MLRKYILPFFCHRHINQVNIFPHHSLIVTRKAGGQYLISWQLLASVSAFTAITTLSSELSPCRPHPLQSLIGQYIIHWDQRGSIKRTCIKEVFSQKNPIAIYWHFCFFIHFAIVSTFTSLLFRAQDKLIIPRLCPDSLIFKNTYLIQETNTS